MWVATTLGAAVISVTAAREEMKLCVPKVCLSESREVRTFRERRGGH